MTPKEQKLAVNNSITSLFNELIDETDRLQVEGFNEIIKANEKLSSTYKALLTS
ncbi:MAG: hypothetical protein RL710_2794 [Pseudomonadota bacterium]|jgi:hypothetical protein